MTERRTLVEGLSSTPPAIDPAVERSFVHRDKATAAPMAATSFSRVPISTRIREDFAKSLKRASLERQLKGIEPNTLQDILEEAIEPWLKSNGYPT